MEILDGALSTLVYLVACFILFIVGKIVYQMFNRDIKVAHELVENDNFAFAVSHTGYYIGLLLAMGSALMGESSGLLLDLMDIGIYGGIAIIL